MKVDTLIIFERNFVSISKISREKFIQDRNYLFGTLAFYDDENQVILQKELYDDVNWLWELIIQAMYDFIVCHNQMVSFSYPSQQICFQLKILYSDFVNLKIYSNSEIYLNENLDKTSLIHALLQGAEDFFNFYKYSDNLTNTIKEIKFYL